MRTTPEQRETKNRVERFLREAAQDISSGRFSRASRNLRRFLHLHLGPDARFNTLLLEAECSLETRRFSSARSSLDNAALLSSNPTDLDRLHLLRAYLLALSGDALDALHEVVPILRKANPMGGERAKGLWIAGLACYRRGHYTWAKRCFHLSAAFYRLNNQARELAHVLMNLALVAKSEGNIRIALNYLDEAASYVPGST